MNFLKIYRREKDVFIKPKLKWYFGPWWKEGNLPVWRRGPQIRLGKYHQMYIPKFSVLYQTGISKEGYKIYNRSDHELPVKPYKYVWTREIRKKLKKYHLSWIPPIVQLPIWLSFYFWDRDIYYKTKYDEFRFEYPAHITLVLFGLAISVTAVIPNIGNNCEDDYWECLLEFTGDLKETDDKMGWWRKMDGTRYKVFNPDFLKEPYRSELIKIQNGESINSNSNNCFPS